MARNNRSNRGSREGSNRGRNGGRRKQSNSTQKFVLIGLGIVALAVVIYFLTGPSSTTKINDTSGVVGEVLSGNTVKLKNGLTVELLGVENTKESENFLKNNLVGKQVYLKADSHDMTPTWSDPSKDRVRAYINLEGSTTYNNVNGSMIIRGLTGANEAFCQDSIAAFRSYQAKNGAALADGTNGQSSASGRLYDDVELGKKITPCTFLVIGRNAEGMSIGTGFFINDRGLAVSNYHVFAEPMDYIVFFADEKGNISPDNGHPIGRVLDYSSKDDYCIFTVKLDNGEKVPYLNIAKQTPERGEKVAVVGNPSKDGDVYTSTFNSTGTITALRPERHEIQVDVNMTHGNSGGPIVNFYGEVVGIAKRIALDRGRQNGANLNFGVDIQTVRAALDNLKADIAQQYGGK